MNKQQEKIFELLELASDHIDYWTGTMIAEMMEQDIRLQDYKSLENHIKESARLMFEQEYNADYALYERS